MKLIYLLLTIFFINIYSAASAQRITYAGKNVPLKTVFAAIQKQAGYGFFYDQKILSGAKPVSVDFKNTSLTDVLAAIFNGQALEYNIDNKTILVKKKPVTFNSPAAKPEMSQPGQTTANAKVEKIKKPDPDDPAGNKSEEKVEYTPDIIKDSDEVKLPAGQVAAVENKTPASETGKSTGQAQPSSASPSALNTTKQPPGTGLKDLFSPIQLRKINIGFKGGMNSSRIYATEPDGSKSGYIGTELYGGFFADTRLTEKLNLSTELIFSYTHSYHFIELPAHLKYKLTGKLNVMAGPKLDYIADKMDKYDNFKRFGLSAEMGSQYRINSLFFAEVRYAYGFTPQINSPFFDFYNGSRNTFRLGLGVNFNRQEDIGKVSKELGPMRLRAALNTGVGMTSGYDIVVGADLRIQKKLSSASIGMLTAGYNHYSLKSGFIETNLAYFPVKAGMKFMQDSGFYIAPEAGIAIGTKSEVYTIPFAYAAGIGKQTRNGFDISLRYEKLTGHIVDYLDEIKRPAQLALRVEYGFNLNSEKNASGSFGSLKATPATTGTRKKSIFLELGGTGVGISGNFDIRLKQDQNYGLGIKVGVGTSPEFLTLPLGLNYIVGKRRHGFETGIGITPVYSTTDHGHNIVSRWIGYWDVSPRFHAAGFLTAGYRFQSYKGFMFRANTSIAHSHRYFSFGWPGLSVGYSFK